MSGPPPPPPPTDPQPNDAGSEGTPADAEPAPAAPRPEPAWPVEPPAEPTVLTAQPPPDPVAPAQRSPTQPAATGTAGASVAKTNVDRATALTEEFLDRGAPWSANTSWRIVLGEGIVAVIVGLIVLLQPLGVSTTLQIVGFALLVGALLTAFQIWRGRIEPGREVLAAFRSGSGVTVGLVVIVATFFTAVTDTVTASLAVIVGVGFIVFGLAGIAGSFIGRREIEPLPAAVLIANATLVVAGIVLMLSGAAGSTTVGSVFNLLGVAFIVAGLGLAGYGYMLRQQEQQGFRR